MYLHKQGWVLFDPTTTHSDIQSDGKNYKMQVKNKYITFCEGRNDPVVHGYVIYYNYELDDVSKDKIKLNISSETVFEDGY